MQRAFWVWLHRWAGLAIAAFLIVVGLTGNLLAFYPELNRLFNSRAYQITEGWHNLMPFIYKLHYSLALGSFGIWVLGICALIWTLDCFVEFYLTLPQRRRRSPPSAIPLADGRGGRDYCKRM